MADLNVQPKRRAPVWPWLLLILVAIAAVAYFVMRDKDVVTDDIDSDSTTVNSADTVIQSRTDTGVQYHPDTTRMDTIAR